MRVPDRVDPISTASIRRAEGRDLDDIAAIERSAFNDPWSRRSFADLVDAPQVLFLVAATDAGVVGYAIVLVAGVESELANLAVARIAQRKGLGRRLLGSGLDAARSRGCQEIFLEVRASNVAALDLYTKAGFEAVGRRVRYYARPVEDAVVMRASLSSSTPESPGNGTVRDAWN